ncbi:hypothetical protein [Niastella sp. OAS944]|uniref:hypothetical protein n=1 Tax=Niastella sp. OAS944 TaxID=2664089 RepID=UPI00347DDBB9|nr:cytochrome c biogenesis protein CcdA [Chitinophagaceae bacterium OAS944]
MNKPWLYYITPCILAAVIALFFTILGIVDNSQSGGFSIILVFFLILALCMFIGLDWMVKYFIEDNLLLIWIIEILLIAFVFWLLPGGRWSGC